MKRILSFLLVLTMLCSFGLAFAQEEAPAEETPAEEIIETVPEEPAEEAAPEETAEEVPAEEPVEEPAEAAEETVPVEEPAAEEVPAEEPAVDGASEEPAEEIEEEPVTDGSTYSGTCGTNVKWSLNTETGVLTISGTGAMKNYSDEYDIESGYDGRAPWRYQRNYVKSVVIESGVTSIGSYAFYNCSRLMSVTIPSGVTSIGGDAFDGCSSLTAIDVDGANAYYASEEGVLFNKSKTQLIRCPGGKIGTYVIPDSVTSIGYKAFRNCGSLTSVTVHDGVTSIGEYAFYKCSSLTAIDVDSANAYYASEEGVLFNKSKTQLIRCPGGKVGTYVIPDSVTSIRSYAFGNCSSLTSVTIPDSVTSIGKDVFYNCRGLTSVTIGSGVTSISSHAFYYCSSLASVTIPESVTSIGSCAFYGCSGLKDVCYGGYKTAGNSVSIGDNNTCLTNAVWHYACTVSYNANGGSGAPADQKKTDGLTLTLSSEIPTRTGYEFLGWSTDSTAPVAEYTAGGSYTADGNATLYAVWSEEATVLTGSRTRSVEFAQAGGKVFYSYTPTDSRTYVVYSNGPISASVALYDASGTLLARDSGVNFRVACDMTAGETYRIVITAAEAGAVNFTYGRVYTVRYNANGGIGAPAIQTKDYASDLTLTADVPARIGYNFLGWATTKTAAEPMYTAGGTYTANGNVTLYAVWEEDAFEHAVMNTSRTYTAKITEAGGKVYYDYTSASTRTYVLYSCGTAAADVSLYDESSNLLAESSGTDFRIAAVMTAGKTYRFVITADEAANVRFTFGRVYTIKFNANGGSDAPADVTKDYGRTLTLPETRLIREGYTFLGWSADASAETAAYKAGGEYTANGNTTLYAVWAEGEIETVTMSSGYTYTAAIASPGEKLYYEYTPTAANTYVLYSAGSEAVGVKLYDANGELLAESGTANGRIAYAMEAGETYLFEVGFADTSAAGSLTLKFGRAYTVRYNANSGTGAPEAQTKDYGAVLTLSGTIPTRPGYTFLGWDKDRTAETASYQAGAAYTANGNTTLYAVWDRSPAGTLVANKTYSAAITSAGAKVYYEYTPSADNTYVMYSTGSKAVSVNLYNADSKLLASSGTANGRVAYAMEAGVTYLFEVGYADASATGSIVLKFGRVYTVKYSSRGWNVPDPQTRDYGTTLTLSSRVPVSAGEGYNLDFYSYTFLGWATSKNGAVVYQPGDSYTANGNAVLYGVWEKD